MFLWTDLETTGLNPATDVPLAIGIIVTDDGFREVARGEWVIGWDGTHKALAGMSEFVRNMHSTNGLLPRVRGAWREGRDVLHVSREICRWLTPHLGPTQPEIKLRPPWAGNTVHFDKAFVERHMPDLARRYNYRCLDVSTLKVIAQAISPAARAWEAARPDGVHTPLKDLEASLAEFAHWRRTLFNPEIGCCPYYAVTHRGPPIIADTPSTYEPCTLSVTLAGPWDRLWTETYLNGAVRVLTWGRRVVVHGEQRRP